MFVLLLKASLVIVILLAFYKLFLERESFFTANRIYLLGCLILAGILPFIALPELMENQGYVTTLLEKADQKVPAISEEVVSTNSKENFDVGEAEENAIEQTVKSEEQLLEQEEERLEEASYLVEKNGETKKEEALTETNEKQGRSAIFWIIILYLFGVVILFFHLFAQIIGTLFKAIKNDDKVITEEGIIINLEGATEPCSFFNYIFINPESYDFDTYEQIIVHEKIHVQKWHSLDLLLAELAVILLWFNPFVWIFRKEVEKNIEYQTDDILTKDTTQEKEGYQMNLLKIATYNKPLTITTNYNQSLIKKRILKMNTKKSNPYSYWKYAFVLPVLFLTLLAMNEPYDTSNESKKLTSPITNHPSSERLETTNGKMVDQIENDDFDRFMQAIKDNDIDAVKRYLSKGVNLYGADEKGMTPLLLATMKQHKKIAKLLTNRIVKDAGINRNRNENQVNENIPAGRTTITTTTTTDTPNTDEDFQLLMKAIKDDDLKLVRQLLDKGADMYGVDEDGFTPLLLASYEQRGDIAKLLVERITATVGFDFHFDSDDAIEFDGEEIKIHDENDNVRHNDYEGHNDRSHYDNNCKTLIKTILAEDISKIKGLLETIDSDCVDPNPDRREVRDGQNRFYMLDPRTPLTAAALVGNVEIGKLLVKADADVNFSARGDQLPIMTAAEKGHLAFVKYLRSLGVAVNTSQRGEGTVLSVAARGGHLDIVKYLVAEGAEIDSKTKGEGTPLSVAARSGHLEVVKFLLDKGADINSGNEWDGTPLLVAARSGHLHVVKFLVEKGADINNNSRGEGTPLSVAARSGHLPVVKYLLEKGADINTDSQGEGTPLSVAARSGHLDVVELLLEKGANINADSRGEGTPLSVAARSGHLEVVKYLLEKRADINANSQGEGTPLSVAARSGHLDVVELLLNKGADINADSRGEGTPLSVAARSGHLNIVKYLLGKGADINAVSQGEGTPLSVAARSGHLEVVKYLLEKGADINSGNEWDGTPLSVAKRSGHEDVVKYLISQGAKR